MLKYVRSIDKITFSVCGSKCGYIISHPDLFNPINCIFVNLSKVFTLHQQERVRCKADDACNYRSFHWIIFSWCY